MLREALNYLSIGLSVIPLKPKSKEPLISWTEFQHRKATEQEVNEWFCRWPNANIGIVTGSISGIVIIDLDGPEGLASAQSLGLKSSVVSLTGNGRHLWYKANTQIANAVRIYPGIDIRAEGGYIAAPGSIHESGKRYRFINVLTNAANLPEFPKELISLLQKSTETGSEQTLKNINYSQKSESWIAKALEDMKDGNIDNTLTMVLGRLRHDGYTAKDAYVLLQPHALAVGAEQGHLEAKIENIWNRYEPKTRFDVLQTMSNSTQWNKYGTTLVIHSPTNPDSLKQFEQLSKQSALDNEAGRLQTGYSKLDRMLEGGLKSSRLLTVAARTGTGKTNFLIGVARTLCEVGKRVLIFSTETPYTEFWSRYMATLSKPAEFKDHTLYVCDSFAPNIEKVEEAISKIKPDVFMFDHINHVSEEQRELGAFMQGLNFLRRKYDCAGIVTAQLNRSADWVDLKTGEKVTPRMSMIKGSGTIEQASSRVLLLSETRVLPEYTEIIGNLDKNDNGPKGLIHFGLMNKPYKMMEL